MCKFEYAYYKPSIIHEDFIRGNPLVVDILPFIENIERVSCNLDLGQSQLILTFVHIYSGQTTSC